jgi:sulfate transport system permease protein
MSMPRGRTLPGFAPAMTATLAWLSFLVLIPLSMLFVTAANLDFAEFWHVISSPRALSSYKLTFGTALLAALANGAGGLLLAWVLVRYSFPGKDIMDALLDIPFALPTAVAGLAYASLYSPEGWLGRLLNPLGISAAHNRLAVWLVLTYVSLPFVVRTLQPVLSDLGTEPEEAASSLGASPWQSFAFVLVPHILPALLTGMALAFARAVGEYGSVVFVSGNIPFRTEITPLVILGHLESYHFAEAAAVAVVMLLASFAINGIINLLSRWSHRHD